jgi:hypothetical protein
LASIGDEIASGPAFCKWDHAMCDKCTETQAQIAKFRHFLDHPLDPLTKERLTAAVVEMEAKLLGFHPRADK